MTLGHTNVPYKLCEQDWRGLRFGYGYEKASLGGCRGTLDLCMGTLFEVPAAVGEEPFDVGFLQAWLLLITASVLAAFFIMFRRIVNRYCGRIASLPAKVKIWQTFPARGWILIVFMMGLGIALRHIPAIPPAFTASLYSGL